MDDRPLAPAPSDRPDLEPATPASPDRRGRAVLAAGAAVVAALLAGLVLGRGLTDPGEELDPVAVGFAQDMATHHAQAVAMSAVAHRRVTDPALNYLAEDILTTQQGQIGIMSAWLTDAGQPQTNPGAVMAWMGDAHTGPMPGMASPAQIEQLATLPVPQLEEQYLRLMVRHHAGAVPMAAYAAAHTDSPKVAALAENMESGQSAEIRALNGLLTDRGLPPEPATGAHGAAPAPTGAASHGPGHSG